MGLFSSIASTAGSLVQPIVGAFGASKEQSQRNRAASSAERTRQADIERARKFAREEVLSPEQIALRDQLAGFFGPRLEERRPFTERPSFLEGRDLISRGAETARGQLRGTPGIPAGLFAKARGQIGQGEQQAQSSLISQGITQEEQELNQLIAQILQLISLGTPRFGFTTPGTPISPAIGKSPETVFGSGFAEALPDIRSAFSPGGSQVPSDRSLKENIKELERGLDTLNKMKPSEYDFKEDNRHSIGFIAQELKELLPEVVHGEEGLMSVEYALITTILVKAVQELSKRVEELENDG